MPPPGLDTQRGAPGPWPALLSQSRASKKLGGFRKIRLHQELSTRLVPLVSEIEPRPKLRIRSCMMRPVAWATMNSSPVQPSPSAIIACHSASTESGGNPASSANRIHRCPEAGEEFPHRPDLSGRVPRIIDEIGLCGDTAKELVVRLCLCGIREYKDSAPAHDERKKESLPLGWSGGRDSSEEPGYARAYSHG